MSSEHSVDSNAQNIDQIKGVCSVLAPSGQKEKKKKNPKRRFHLHFDIGHSVLLLHILDAALDVRICNTQSSMLVGVGLL